MYRSPLTRLTAVASILLCSACSSIDSLTSFEPIVPWVKPYERDRMADPIMSFDRDPVSTAYMAHVYGVREGSRGGQGGNGGGCGCN
jgi:hypothetical protein